MVGLPGLPKQWANCLNPSPPGTLAPLSLQTCPYRANHPAETRTFAKRASALPGGGERTFVQFILEPLYKIYAQVGCQ